MAKHRKSKKHHGHKRHSKRRHKRSKGGLGSIITFRSLKGLGSMDSGTIVPMFLGGVVTAGVAVLLRAQLPLNTGSQNNAKMVKYAPILGLGAGVIASIGYAMFVSKKTSDRDIGILASLLAGGTLMSQDFLALKGRGGEIATSLAGFGAIVPQMGGFGAIVPQLNGVTVLEPWTAQRPDSLGQLGNAGEVLSFNGVDTSVFGTSSYTA